MLVPGSFNYSPGTDIGWSTLADQSMDMSGALLGH